MTSVEDRQREISSDESFQLMEGRNFLSRYLGREPTSTLRRKVNECPSLLPFQLAKMEEDGKMTSDTTVVATMRMRRKRRGIFFFFFCSCESHVGVYVLFSRAQLMR